MAVKTLDGREIESCDLDLFRYKQLSVIVVTGASYNPCGHALLNVGGTSGYYIHVAGWHSKPHFMTQGDYETYLAGHGKQEILRKQVYVPFLDSALLYLERVVSKTWSYGLVVHNCATLVEDVFKAGGAYLNFNYNCPNTILRIRQEAS
jgi:hypothetical protein